MSERERWIVYPLLFLALGAALRDKIIKTTESQRIKCQGLWVLDSNDETLLLLGPEQFPDIRPSAPNLLHIDEVVSDRVTSDVVAGNKVEGVQFLTPQDRVGKLVADEVVARNYVLTDGQHTLKIDGRLTVPIMRVIAGLAARYQTARGAAQSPAAANTAPPESPPAGEADAGSSPSVQSKGDDTPAAVDDSPSGEPTAE